MELQETSLPDQALYSLSNRRWLGSRERHLDQDSYKFLMALMPDVEGRIIDANPGAKSHQDSIEEMRLKALAFNQPWGAVVPINVITTKYLLDLLQGYHVDIRIPRGRIKTTDHATNRAATGSAAIIFYPEEGQIHVSLV